MRRLQIVLGSLATTAMLLAATPASAEAKRLSGDVTIGVHTHSDPSLLFPTNRLAFGFARGDTFAYSSRTCAQSAPFNEVGLDFDPDYPGIDTATGVAAVRHLAEGRIVSVTRGGTKGTILGTITSVVCVTRNGARVSSADALVMSYSARFRRTSDNELYLKGRFWFSPSRSTGTFEDITGRGSLEAQITCLGHARNPALPSCEDLGRFNDFVGLRGNTAAPPGQTTPGLIGHFRDHSVGARSR
ncbi:MAG: hypothetical protein Q8K79_13885 [Solirubrobacteraceae bacterium]|nr:hypothetical protein [Solirubrobacteraceae bacterium]